MPIEHDSIGETPAGGPCVRVTTFEGSPENVERVLTLLADRMLPSLRGQPGWQGLLGLASPDRNRAVAISFWDSESALRESGSNIGAYRSRAREIGISVTDLERLEVVFHETSETP
jgi:heme-degrading monooxygenase HmoA